MKLRMKKMPRPLDLRRFSGTSGSSTVWGSKPLPWVEHTNGQLRGLGDRVKLKLDDDPFCLIFIVAMFDRVDYRFAHSNADPVHGVIIEVPDFSDVIAQDLNQIEHVEVTGKLQADRMPDFRHARLRYSAAVPHARVSGSAGG